MKEKAISLQYSTVDDILIVEKTIRESKDDLSKLELLNALPIKMNARLFNIIIAYLKNSGKIIIERGKIVWTWDPEGIKHIKNAGLLIK